MITEKQKQKMLECLDAYNFCKGVHCKDCPLQRSSGSGGCLMWDLRHKVDEIETKSEKKLCFLCPVCGHELDKEIEE